MKDKSDSYLYTDNDISVLINHLITTQMRGFRPNHSYLLAGDHEGLFTDADGHRYLVMLTSPITTSTASGSGFSEDYFLDKSRQASAGKEVDTTRDVFDECGPLLLNNDNCNIKILFPYHIVEKNHWLVGEIQIHKQDKHCQIFLMAHDPMGAGQLSPSSYRVMSQALTKQFSQLVPSIKIQIINAVSPYLSPRQAVGDVAACGVINVEETLKRIRGESLDQDNPYPLGMIEIRKTHLSIIEKLPADHPTRKSFLVDSLQATPAVRHGTSFSGLMSKFKKLSETTEDDIEGGTPAKPLAPTSLITVFQPIFAYKSHQKFTREQGVDESEKNCTDTIKNNIFRLFCFWDVCGYFTKSKVLRVGNYEGSDHKDPELVFRRVRNNLRADHTNLKQIISETSLIVAVIAIVLEAIRILINSLNDKKADDFSLTSAKVIHFLLVIIPALGAFVEKFLKVQEDVVQARVDINTEEWETEKDKWQEISLDSLTRPSPK